MRSSVLFFVTLISVYIQDLTALDQQLRDYFLSTHNNYRSQLALGKIKNKNGTALPTASNIYELRYSLEVEKIAQDWADGCNIAHAIINKTTNNLFAEHPYREFNAVAQRGVTAWLHELESKGLLSLNFTMDVYKTEVGHWVEANWHDVKEIGCGIANCSKVKGASPDDRWTYVVCAYNPGGNWLNELVYTPGKPCSHCTSYPNSKCNKKTGLCYIDDGGETTRQHSSSVKLSTVSSTESSDTSKTTNEQNSTDEQRESTPTRATRLSRTFKPTVPTTTSGANMA